MNSKYFPFRALAAGVFRAIRIPNCCPALLVLLGLTGSFVRASDRPKENIFWGATGHSIINLRAVRNLPASMSSWKADSIFIQQHASDADNRKISGDTAFWNEADRHFIDIDYYPNYKNLSHNLDSVILQYGRTTVRNTGTNPWAVVWELDSLTAQFRRGDAASAQQTMADLGHYIGDPHQPLHAAKNFDGQYTGNNGIHSRYETNMINTYQSQIVTTVVPAQYVSKPIDYIFAYIYQSNSYVDSIMAADNYAKSASGWNGSVSAPSTYYAALWSQVGNFTIAQFQRATVDLANLWYTAWVNSQTMDTIASSAGPNGSISPSGNVILNPGSTQRFVFTPSSGYRIDSVFVDGVSVDSMSGYTFTNVIINHTISVTYRIQVPTYTITASASAHGTIAPSGSIPVDSATTQRFVFTPSAGCYVDSVFIDGNYVDSTAGYTFFNIATDHSIVVQFAITTYTISASSSANGNIAPSGNISVAYGNSQRFIFAPSSGFEVDSVFVDGSLVDSTDGYTFSNVTANHQIRCVFGILQSSVTLNVLDKWNLISLPVLVPDNSKGTLFPTATTSAFSYDGTYTSQSSLILGQGYWLKFHGAQPVHLKGVACTSDTIALTPGWNLIGSISAAVPVAQITFNPPALELSKFFGYSSTYAKADTIQPGYGYWVKASASGQLFLNAGGGTHSRPVAHTK